MKAIVPDEVLSRFIVDSDYFSRVKNEVKYRAFMPDPHMDLSVFRTTGWTEGDIWQVGVEQVVNSSTNSLPRSLKARADLVAKIVQDNELEVIPDEPPPDHAIIIGWPNGESKDKRKLIAMKLAKSATLSIHTD